MTSTLILESLASEFSIEADSVRRILEMLDGGLTPAHIGRHRRGETKATPEHVVRRVARRRDELVELDRRRATIRRMLESIEGLPKKVLENLERTTDRFELEDLYLPFRKPEPEVQLALDRGLGVLADRLTAPLPKQASNEAGADTAASDDGGSAAAEGSVEAPTESADGAQSESSGEPEQAPEQAPVEAGAAEADASEGEGETVVADEGVADESVTDAGSAPEATPVESATEVLSTEGVPTEVVPTEGEQTEAASPGEEQPAEGATPAATEVDGVTDAAPAVSEAGAVDAGAQAPAAKAEARTEEPARPHAPHVELTPDLARLCAEFVAPDRGIHTEEEALNGAMRILADRLGRATALRGQLRKLLRRQGVLDVQPGPSQDRAARHKGLLKIEQPMKQLQGHRLIAIRQAQRDRAVTTVIKLDRERSLPVVRKALARRSDPAFDGALSAVTEVALEQRLLPMLEADVRLELKERGDEEALRFIASHLREVLLTPPVGRRVVAGVDVSPKGDYTLVVLGEDGRPRGEEIKLEVSGKEDVQLAEELAAAMRESGAEWLACSHNRSVRPAVRRLRTLVGLTQSGATVALVNETGIASWINSENGRRELGEHSVQARFAVVLARRLQDPLSELLNLDPRHLGLGVEKSLVSKANLKHVIDSTVESCVALVGVDVNEGPEHVLKWVPGLDGEAVKRILAARAEEPFASREALRERGVLNETEWQNASAFLRVRGAELALDRSSLHPDQYPLAMRLVEATGEPADAVIGRFGGLKGLRRADFDVDEHTWRDLVREIGHPGRDPRPRLMPAKPLAADTDPTALEVGQVVEGFVCNVAVFGAFVDLGIEREGFIHISAMSQRFVRDARELTSIGRAVRAKVTEIGGSRIGLTLVDVPDRERPPRRGGRPSGDDRGRRGRGSSEGGARGGRRGGPRGHKKGAEWSDPERMTRVARVRRDGMPGDEERRDRGPRRGGPGGGPGRGRRDQRGGDRGGDRDAAAFAKGSKKSAPKNTPFAKFFDNKDEGEVPEES
ncbi:MAG: S1 RNA-binding domain-containing protein [Planctomycetota bacterium]